MMSRFFSRFKLFLALWMLTSGVSTAQVHVLRLNLELLRNARKMEQQAIKKKDSLLLAEAYFQYGELYQSAANNLASKRYYLKALHLLEPRGDSFELGRILLRVGASLNVHADSKEDIDYAYRSLRVFERIHSLRGVAMAYGIIGGMYHRRWAGYETLKKYPAKYDSIAFCYKKVEQLGRQLQDTAFIAEGKSRMAGLFMTFKDRRAIADLQWVLDWNEQKKHDTAVLNP